jgi:hypothetical protein
MDRYSILLGRECLLKDSTAEFKGLSVQDRIEFISADIHPEDPSRVDIYFRAINPIPFIRARFVIDSTACKNVI